MQVIFIHHSCFLVEIDDKVLIFDYFDGNRVNGYHFHGKLPSYAPDTPIYLFASHSHQDHFDMDVLRWAEHYTNIHYILSKDIRISPNFLAKHGIDPKVREKVLFVAPDKQYEISVEGDNISRADMQSENADWTDRNHATTMIRIRTYKSTDAGVAFYVDVAGVTLFHAGDLSDWRMAGAGDLINGKAKREYQHQIKKLAKLPINLAFVPMDPRLGEYQFEGIDYFVRHTDAEFVFPMHMWQDYRGIVEYKKRITNLGMADRIIEVERENQVFPFGEL